MSSKQVLVVGLGQFGMAVTEALQRLGVDVLAVDRDPARVEAASVVAAQALGMDATDEAALASTAPARRDTCICAIGNDARESSILVTALLRQLGARHIVSRASDPLLERILRLVGAHEIVNPEAAFGRRLARRLRYAGILEEMPLGEDLVISELVAVHSMVGRSLRELELPRRFGLLVVALRRQVEADRAQVIMPDPDAPLAHGDILIVVSEPGAARAMVERLP